MRETAMYAVGDRAVVEQRGEHQVGGAQQIVFAAHVEEGFLLAGERGLGQVLGGGGGSDRNREFAALAHLAVGPEHLVVEAPGKGRRQHPAADFLADHREAVHVVHVERRQDAADPLVEAALRQEVAVGVGRGRKAARHRDAQSRQTGYHFADRRILAPDQLDIFDFEFFERNDVGIHDGLLVPWDFK